MEYNDITKIKELDSETEVNKLLSSNANWKILKISSKSPRYILGLRSLSYEEMLRTLPKKD
jgi:hypothetical protein